MDRTPADQARAEADRRAREMQLQALRQLDGLPLVEQATRVMAWLAEGRIWRDVAADWAEARWRDGDNGVVAGLGWALDRIVRFDARIEGQDTYLFTPTDMAAWLAEVEHRSAGQLGLGSDQQDR